MSPNHNGNRRPPNIHDVDPNSFGGQLRYYRDQAGLTQKELAYISGVKQQQLSNYERGLYTPDEDVIIALADALKIRPGLLFEAGPFRGVLPVGSKRRERLKHLGERDWRLFDKVLDELGDITPEERARFERGFQRFLEEWDKEPVK